MNLLANYSTSTISLKFIAPLGNEYIAAASLATSTYWMFGKLLVQSLCGALDTRASQVGHFIPSARPRTLSSAKYPRKWLDFTAPWLKGGVVLCIAQLLGRHLLL